MPFYKSADTLSRFRGHPFTIPRTPFHDSADTLSRFRGHPFTIPRTPFHDSADTLSRFRGHPFTIPRTPTDDSADTLARFRGHPCTIPRISSAMPRKTCGFPTRTIRGFRKVSFDKYRISLDNRRIGAISLYFRRKRLDNLLSLCRLHPACTQGICVLLFCDHVLINKNYIPQKLYLMFHKRCMHRVAPVYLTSWILIANT